MELKVLHTMIRKTLLEEHIINRFKVSIISFDNDYSLQSFNFINSLSFQILLYFSVCFSNFFFFVNNF